MSSPQLPPTPHTLTDKSFSDCYFGPLALYAEMVLKRPSPISFAGNCIHTITAAGPPRSQARLQAFQQLETGLRAKTGVSFVSRALGCELTAQYAPRTAKPSPAGKRRRILWAPADIALLRTLAADPDNHLGGRCGQINWTAVARKFRVRATHPGRTIASLRKQCEHLVRTQAAKPPVPLAVAPPAPQAVPSFVPQAV